MKRDISPDVLRGFALLGIFMGNVQFMAFNSEQGARGEWVEGFANGSATLIMTAIFAGKFYLLFSFLFGYSSSYIIKNDKSNRARWVKRCLALMLVGFLHAALLWHGDILFMYGLFGLLLLLFFFRKDRTLKIWSRLIYAIYAIGLTLVAILVYIVEQAFPEEVNFDFTLSQLDSVMLTGNYVDSILPRLDLWIWGLIGSGLFLQGGLAFAAFLLGIRAARRNLLSNSAEQVNLKRIGLIGLIVGLPIQIICGTIYVNNEQSSNPSGALYLGSLLIAFTAAPMLSATYVWLLLKLISLRPKLVSWMAAAGRMSLTTYLSQSLIASFIFGPWGLGLFQELEMWQVLILVLFVWIFQVVFAHFWLSRFKQGPMEWALSKMTQSRKKSMENPAVNLPS